MHPVVIMSYDKSPAITKAVAALEEAGMEVVVLNTKTAKLVQFLGALAGEDPDADDEENKDDAPPADEPPADEPPADEEPAPEDEDLEPIATEALLNDEKVIVEIVDGGELVLYPSEVSNYGPTAKIQYWINESQFSFWGREGEKPVTSTMLKLGEQQHFAHVRIGDAQPTPVLKIGRDWLKEAKYPTNSWAMLPAAQAVFDKGKVTPDEVDKELNHTKGKILIVQRSVDKYPEPKTSIIMVPGQGDSMKVGTSSDAHHDQTFGKLGRMTVIGILKKDGDEWKLEGDKKIPGLETPEQIKKFKAPVYVFK